MSTPSVEQPSPTVDDGMEARLAAFAQLDGGARADAETPLLRELILATGRAANGGEFTSDDIRPHLPMVNMNRIGRVFASLKAEGRLVETGWRSSKVPSAHGRKVGVYRLAEWLQ
ncbi:MULTISPECIES: hypothetical protein [unclassified Aeromicrobium]|uniref:hypothetical protein n=1 Tax=unclassified Aeromicrobium TaxID=2633570 RepID=UPI00288A2241|nr:MULTISPECIES: hypothetical protein [unclassified Aeromicrobium]